jgi:multicomponent Na+:H+ antiporter subunit F
MVTVTAIAFAGLLVSALLCVVRLVRGQSVADRIVALDLLLVITVSGISVTALATGSGIFLDVLVVASLLGFVGTITVARYMERRGA